MNLEHKTLSELNTLLYRCDDSLSELNAWHRAEHPRNDAEWNIFVVQADGINERRAAVLKQIRKLEGVPEPEPVCVNAKVI